MARRQAQLAQLADFVQGLQPAFDLSILGELQADGVQMQLLPEMTPIARQDTITPETTAAWHACAPRGGCDGALLAISNRTPATIDYQLTVSGDLCNHLSISSLQWVGETPDCAFPAALGTIQNCAPDSLSCFAVEFHTDTLAPGAYQGVLVLMPLSPDLPVRRIDLHFEVLEWQMPEHLPIRTYLNDYGIALDEDMIPLMRRGRVNTFQFHHQGRDLSRIAPLTRQMQAAGLRENAFVCVEEWFTREEGWHEADNAWLDQLVAAMEANGWHYQEWCLHIFDETLGDLFLECAKAIKAHNPKVQIFSDMIVTDLQQLERFVPYVDFFCPKLDTQAGENRDKYLEATNFLRSGGKPVWLYDCDSRASHPIDHSRILAWVAWLDGDQGILFWSLIPSNLRSHSASRDFGLTYQLGDRKYPSRRLLMWFAGLEDYLLLEEAARIAPLRTRQLARQVVDAFAVGKNQIAPAHYAARQELLEIIAGRGSAPEPLR